MPKPAVLHIGEPIKYNHEFYENEFLSRFNVVQDEEPDRASFMEALKSKKYGDFSAIYRPHFQTGGEIGQWDDELIPIFPASVRIFASAGARFNWANVDALAGLATRKIWYSNGAGASDEAVSDTALYPTQRYSLQHIRLSLRSREIPGGHILGIIGLGNISKKLAYKAKTALGMDIHYYDAVRASEEEEKTLGATFHASLDDLLKIADCISLHRPLNKHTQNLIDAKAIALMKPGSRIVNTARGLVVNENALVAALVCGHISAVALDVHYHEPQVSKKLAAMEQCTLTTHIAGGALDTRINFEVAAMKNIIAVLGPDDECIGTPLTPVNAKAYNAAA
ncbi:2-ketogluconate reductase [Mytilinidion resinicola]|uniref:2-ketogluconate reductase n=1 Tax=Mytilinidion resinicola TaxID=574789 RepID=A0A6A6YW26_9PEZI|nr:2-ketogluconate reductase [Mytilinidion resinicola]KAF2813011.1 2-ketogluconate reductase [Mytilinidion resinicola]